MAQEIDCTIERPDADFVFYITNAQERLDAIRSQAPEIAFEDYWEQGKNGNEVLVAEWYEESAKVQQDIVRFLFATEGDDVGRTKLGASLKMFWLVSEDHAKRLESAILQYRFMSEVRNRGHYCELPNPCLDAHNGIDVLVGVPYLLPRTGIDIKILSSHKIRHAVNSDNKRHSVSTDVHNWQESPIEGFRQYKYAVVPVADSASHPRYMAVFQRPSNWKEYWANKKFVLEPLVDPGREFNHQIENVVDWLFGREEIVEAFDHCEVCDAAYYDGPCGGECPTVREILKKQPDLETRVVFPKSPYVYEYSTDI